MTTREDDRMGERGRRHRTPSAQDRPIGSERYVDWSAFADGTDHTLRHGEDFFQEWRQVRGVDKSPARLARAAFLTWASRNEYATETHIVDDYTLTVLARKRRAQRTTTQRKTTRRAKPSNPDPEAKVAS